MSVNYHFITDSPWDARELMDQVSVSVSSLLPKKKLTGLIIDESGWEKKGDKSVGVAHQYCGNVGKTSNSQVAVFGCLSNGDFASMVDSRLFIPESWSLDRERCEAAGIPEGQREHRTKRRSPWKSCVTKKNWGLTLISLAVTACTGMTSAWRKGLNNLVSFIYWIFTATRPFTWSVRNW